MKRLIVLLTVAVLISGCCSTMPMGNSQDERPPLMNKESFWDWIPWWRSAGTN